MKSKILIRMLAVCMALLMALTPVNAYAATIIKRGAHGNEVKEVQTTLRDLGYYKYSKVTGYYGSITEAAVKRFRVNGIVEKATRSILKLAKSEKSEKTKVRVKTMSSKVDNANKLLGDLDWFKQVRNILKRGMIAEITDVDTGKTFQVKRTYGTNHADIEPLTKKDTKVIKEIWGGFSWKTRAVIVKFENCTLAASMAAMPHAGVDSKPANVILNKRSEGYGRGFNLDTIKNNGANGVMDLHFKNSRTHGTNKVKKSMQDMVKKAANYIKTLNIN